MEWLHRLLEYTAYSTWDTTMYLNQKHKYFQNPIEKLQKLKIPLTNHFSHPSMENGKLCVVYDPCIIVKSSSGICLVVFSLRLRAYRVKVLQQRLFFNSLEQHTTMAIQLLTFSSVSLSIPCSLKLASS